MNAQRLSVEDVENGVFSQAGPHHPRQAENQPMGRIIPDELLGEELVKTIARKAGQIDRGIFPRRRVRGQIAVNIHAGNVHLEARGKLLQRFQAVGDGRFEVGGRILVSQKFPGIARGLDDHVAGRGGEGVEVLAGHAQELDVGTRLQQPHKGGAHESIGADDGDTHGKTRAGCRQVCSRTTRWFFAGRRGGLCGIRSPAAPSSAWHRSLCTTGRRVWKCPRRFCPGNR